MSTAEWAWLIVTVLFGGFFFSAGLLYFFTTFRRVRANQQIKKIRRSLEDDH